MKRIIFTLNLILLTISIMAQVPAAFSYQAVVRNTSGDIVANKAVKFKFSIKQNSPTGVDVYVETQSATTNSFGLANLKVGMGTKVSGTFDPSVWGSNKHYLKVELDPNNGTSFYHLGTEQLLAVPYAFHSQTVQDIPDNSVTSVKIADNAVVNSKIVNTAVTTDKLANNAVTAPKLASMGATAGQVLVYSGSAWAPQTISTGSSLWQQSGSDIYFNTGKVGIGKIPGGSDMRQFQVLTEGYQAIAGVNNSASYPAIFGENKGSGPAADFRNYIKIIDGTQGADKVLTSDAYGSASWKTGIWASDDNYIYNSSGKKFGIGINKPTQKMTIADGSASCYLNIQNSTTGYASTAGMLVGMEGNNGWVSTYEPGNLYLGTSSAARVIIASDGDVGIGITAPVQKLDINGALNIRGDGSLDIFCNSKEALWFNGTYFSWGYGGEYNFFGDEVTIGTSAVPGYNLVVNGTAAKTGGGSWSVLSDIRLKNLKGEYLKGLKEIVKLKAIKFTYKPENPRDLDTNEEQIGFVAQEVQKVFPEAVTQCRDGYLDFNMHAVNVALINAVKELKAENDLLNNRLEKLEQLVGASAYK